MAGEIPIIGGWAVHVALASAGYVFGSLNNTMSEFMLRNRFESERT
jgi:hypothetical protein